MATLVMDAAERHTVELLRQGNEQAWEEVVRQHQAGLSHYLFNMVQDRELALDLTQDTFLRAYRAIGRTREQLVLKPWLYRIASNRAIEVLRRRRLVSWLPWVDDVLPHADSAGAGQEERFVQAELVRQALGCLPAKYRAVLLLHDNDGFSCEDIGGMLNISLDASKKRLTRARRLFRESYKKVEGT